MLAVSDIYDTSVCPLARVMRQQCKKRGIKSFKVVYSREQPNILSEKSSFLEEHNASSEAKNAGRRDIPGSNAFVPSVVGLIIAGEVIKEIAVK